jgi:hypothetical protein
VLSWVDTSGFESGYRVFRDGTAIGETGANASSVSLAGLGGGIAHTFRVRAFRGEQESAASDPVSIATPPCDVTPPDVGWVEPAGGATIRSRIVRLEATADDSESGVARIEFGARWDGTWREIASLTTSPYRLDWNVCAAGVPDGPLTLRVRAVDGAGNQGTSATDVVKRVDCGPPSPPSVPVFDAPGAGSHVAGDVPIVISASDSYDSRDDLVVEVRIDDGAWINVPYDDQSGRYRTLWNSASVSDGSHTITARATDGGGLTTTSGSIEITVDNVEEPPIARAGSDITVTDGDGNGSEIVALDGRSSSHDPQRTAAYSWTDRWDGGAATHLGEGERLLATLGLGRHAITLTITDSRGLRASDEVVITVSALPDTQPPTAAWSAPAEGASIAARTVRLGATAVDTGGSGLREIWFRARWNGSWHEVARIENPSAGVSFDWDLCTAGVPDGGVELQLNARDGAGNEMAVPVTRRIDKRFGCGTPELGNLAVSPGSGAPGAVVAVTVGGFTPGESVTLNWDTQHGADENNKKKHKGKKKGKGKGKGKGGKHRRGSPVPQAANASVVVASETVSQDGQASLVFSVPPHASAGSHRITAVGSTGKRVTAEFTVTPSEKRATTGRTTTSDVANSESAPNPEQTPDPIPDAAILPETTVRPAGTGGRRHGPDRAAPKRKVKNHRDPAVRPKRESAPRSGEPRARRQ